MENIFKRLLTALAVILTVITARADADFISHRYDSFKACRLNDKSVVFIGNSITNMGNWHEHFGDDLTFVNRGNSGACSYEALENLESILPAHPAKIFVMIGTNDIGTATGTPESIALNARALIDRVANESPDTKLHIVSTFPSVNGLRNLQNHSEINRLLKQECEATGTEFIDLWDSMMGIVDNSISADRLHVTVKGYYIWSNALLPYIGGGVKCTLPATTEAANYFKWTNGNGLRVNMITSLPIKADDVLMIGGEMFNNGEWHELLANPHVKIRAATYGYGDYLSADWVAILGQLFDINKSIKTAPRQIYLNIGSQDINTGVDLGTLKQNYRSCVDVIRRKAPGTKLFLTTLTPHTNAAKNTTTKEFNTFVKSLATELGLGLADLFAATSTADGNPDPRYITTELNAPYASARGYLQLARTLAPGIGDCTVESDEDFLARYAVTNARQKLGNVISASFTTVAGNTTGTVSQSAVEALVDARPEIYALLNDNKATAEQLAAAYNDKYKALLDATAELNQPTSGKSYHITSLRGNRLVHMSTPTAVISTPAAQANAHLASSVWSFVKRNDGAWDIVNRRHDKYLTPSAGVSATAPVKGWTILTHASAGTYAIVSGTDQFHQLNDGGLTSWGGGANLTDQGCAFYLSELPDDYVIFDEPQPAVTTPEGSTENRVVEYTLTAVRGSRQASEAATGNWILGTAGDGDRSLWILYKRPDGTFDIKNKGTGNYVDPDNINASTQNQYMSSAKVPAAGWSFTEIPGMEGRYIITSGTDKQFHRPSRRCNGASSTGATARRKQANSASTTKDASTPSTALSPRTPPA